MKLAAKGCGPGLSVIVAMVLVISILAKCSDTKETQVAKSPRQEMIDRQFSAWDGSHHKLEERIQESMNDPGSYEHVKTTYRDNGDHLIVNTTFRGKNKFGGVVTNAVSAKVSIDGTIIEIIDRSP